MYYIIVGLGFIQSPVTSTVSSTSYLESSRKYSPPKIAEDVVSKPISVSYSSSQLPSRYTSYGSSPSDYAADRLNQIRSRLSLGTPSKCCARCLGFILCNERYIWCFNTVL